MSTFRTIQILVVIVCLFAGCRKKEDENPPQIIFELPSVGSIYDFGDIINIKATIKDDQHIDFIRITVSDAANNEYLQVLNLTSSQNEKLVETLLQHNDKYLTSGTYYIKITAGDGVNEFTAFREIYLNELPLSVERIFVISQSSASIMSIDSLSANGEIMPFIFPNGRYEKGELDSRTATLGMAESYFGGMSSLDMNSLTLNSSIGLPASSESGFYNCVILDPFKHAIYFGGNESQIRKCDSQNAGAVAFVLPEDFIAEHFALNEDFLFVHARNITSTQQNITVFNRSNGEFFQSLSIDMATEIQGIHALSSDDNLVVIAANIDGACELVKYNVSSNALNNVFTFFDQSMCSGIWPGKQGRFFVAHENGLVQYNDDIEMLSTGVVLSPTSFKYDAVGDRIYATESNGLHVLNGNATGEIAFYGITNCRDVMLLYNK